MISLLVNIAAYGLILWGVSTFIPQLGFDVIAGEGTTYGVALLVAAAAFWFLDRVVKKILKIVTVPLNILTLGLAGFLVNILLFYVLQSVVPMIPGVDVTIELGSFIQVAILSVVLSFTGSFIFSLIS